MQNVTKVLNDILIKHSLPTIQDHPVVFIEGTIKCADELAEIAINHGKVEADKLNQLIDFCRNSKDPAKYIQEAITVFAKGLKDRGAAQNTVNSRKCDLKAILICAAQNPDWTPEGGIQGAAKAARKAQKAQQGVDPSEASAEPSRAVLEPSRAIATIQASLVQAWQVAEDASMHELSAQINKIIQGL